MLLAGCGSGNGSSASADAFAVKAGPETQVQTTAGTYEGFWDAGIYTFRGISYARSERFMPPQDPEHFDGVRMAKLYGPKAPQGENLRWNEAAGQTDYSFGNQFVMEPMDEQHCQVLNVWTPGLDDAKRPVFVWIHGGGFSSGSGHDLPCYEGRALAEYGDIVVVNLNHRLNALGYLDLSGLGGKYAESVNLGMQDIVKALEWVKKNISKFGGDPSRVTIAGQSGGGGKVTALLAMPSAKGLFSGAVIQSGSAFHFSDPALSQKFGLDFVKEVGEDKLATASYDELIAAERRASVRFAKESGMKQGRGAFIEGPVVDGKIITSQPFETAAPEESKDVPLLIGSNFNEFSFNVDSSLSEEKVLEMLTQRYGEEKAAAYAEAFKKDYPEMGAYNMVYMDDLFRPGAIQQASLKSQQGGAPAYVYLFNWRPQSNVLGASHGMELPFMFHNVALQREMTGASADAVKLQDTVADAWISFIKTGKPSAAGLPEWPAYDDADAPTMVIDNVSAVHNHLDDDIQKVLHAE